MKLGVREIVKGKTYEVNFRPYKKADRLWKRVDAPTKALPGKRSGETRPQWSEQSVWTGSWMKGLFANSWDFVGKGKRGPPRLLRLRALACRRFRLPSHWNGHNELGKNPFGGPDAHRLGAPVFEHELGPINRHKDAPSVIASFAGVSG